MRIGISGKSLFVAVLILFGILLFSHRAFTRLRGYSFENHINPDNLNQPDSLDPQALLAEANRLSWLNNGLKAGPLYKKAETFSHSEATSATSSTPRLASFDRKPKRCPLLISPDFWLTS